jgi:hypothetical protein
MVSEAVRLLSSGAGEESYEIPFDLAKLHLRRFALRRARACRHDHEITEEVLPAGKTVEELLHSLHDRFGESPVRLECRRGVGRFLTPEGLRERQNESLAALAFKPGDRLRARGPAGSVWLNVRE